jgi:fumigallin biosynthesis monooxygenase-like protein
MSLPVDLGVDGSVGIWHETYKMAPGGYENAYVNMPPFSLGRAGKLQEAKGDLKSNTDRLRANVK